MTTKKLTKIEIVQVDEKLKPQKFHPTDEDLEKITPLDVDLMLYLSKRKKEKKSLFVEFLLVYVPFVIFATMYMFYGYETTNAFYLHNAVKTSHLEEELGYERSDFTPKSFSSNKIERYFKNIRDFSDYYNWVSTSFFSNIFVDQDYNEQDLTRPFQQFVYLQNKAIGSMRIRQLRVKKGSCSLINRLSPKLPNFDQSCYGVFDAFTSDTSPFGTSNVTWKYSTCDQIGNGDSYSGRTIDNIPCDGYTIFVPFANTSIAKNILKELQENNFLDKQTRVVIHEAWLYNIHLNYFTNFNYVLEVTRGGNIVTSLQINSIKMNTFRDRGDIVYFAISLLFILYTFIYIYIFFNELATFTKTRGFIYYFVQFDSPPFINFQNVLDLINLIMIALSLILRFLILVHPMRLNFNVENLAGERYPESLEFILYWTKIDEVVVVISTLVTYLKATKYFKIIETLQLIIVTINISLIGIFTVMFTLFIFLLGFAIAGYISFGFDLHEYRDIISAMTVLLRMLTGELDYDASKEENRMIYPIFFICYMIFGFFIIFNMFVSIISDAIGDAHKKSLNEGMIWGFIPEYSKNLTAYLQRMVTPPKDVNQHNFEIDQGDLEVVERLKNMREAQGTIELTFEDLSEAYKNAPPNILSRIMSRFDLDSSGTLEIKELEELFKKDKNELDNLEKIKILEKKISTLKQKLVEMIGKK